jgi:hypothetical protein
MLPIALDRIAALKFCSLTWTSRTRVSLIGDNFVLAPVVLPLRIEFV